MAKSIQLIDLTKRYATFQAVDHLNLDILRGEICAFLGANGAGKSTTMNMITSIVRKTSGKIYVEGFDMDCQKEKIREVMGVVFQEDILDSKLTVYQNLYTRGGLTFQNHTLLKNRINEVTKMLHIDDLLPKSYAKCSGGQKRFVQIARAILKNPVILILDEPTIGLDPFTRETVWSMLLHLNKTQGITIFYSTHYMEEAIKATQLAILHEGRIILSKNLNSFHHYKTPICMQQELSNLYFQLLNGKKPKFNDWEAL